MSHLAFDYCRDKHSQLCELLQVCFCFLATLRLKEIEETAFDARTVVSDKLPSSVLARRPFSGNNNVPTNQQVKQISWHQRLLIQRAQGQKTKP